MGLDNLRPARLVHRLAGGRRAHDPGLGHPHRRLSAAGLFWPAALLPGVVSGFLFMWPWLDAVVLRDDEIHNVLQTPRDRPGRTAIGAGVLTFLIMLLIAGGDDVFAVAFHWSLPTLLRTLQILVIVLPPHRGGAHLRDRAPEVRAVARLLVAEQMAGHGRRDDDREVRAR